MTSGVYTIQPQVTAPSFTPAAGTYASAQSVSISTTTAGATIRYTTDGSTPSETQGTLYSTPVNISTDTTLEAIAYKSGWTDSAVTSGVYDIQCVPPTFSPPAGTYNAAQSVSISTTTAGATIRYTTDGSTPSETQGTIYNTAVNISANTTLQAIAYMSGMADSPVASGVYALQVVAPTFNPPAGSYTSAQSVTISTTTAGATIRYTTDGSTPSETQGTVYSTAVNISASCTLQAIAYMSGWDDSTVTSGGYTIQCAAPTFSPAAGTYNAAQSVSISTTTGGAKIRYTTDGITPSETQGTVYSTPVNISSTATLQAIAYESGWADSPVTNGVYTIQVAAPTFNPPAGAYGPAQSVAISTTTGGATIRYTTDGSTPSETAGTVYNSAVSISATCTLQAIAYKSGWTDSPVTSGVYTINGPCSAPTFNPAAGTYASAQSVTISTTTSGATISYTTDGSTPSETAGTVYSTPVAISANTTLKAIAYESAWSDSSMTSGVYDIECAAPSFTPPAGPYAGAQSVSISTTTAGATIRYTTNGSTPSETQGTVYSTAVNISTTCTVQAIAYENGMADSPLTSGAYTINGPCAAPTFIPAPGTYASAQSVSISTTTAGATIRYTTDGSTPSETAGTVYSSAVPISVNTTLKAIAYESNWLDSPVTSGVYDIQCAAPTFTPAPATYASTQSVTISTTTAGATIRYTTDGSTPSETAGTVYSNAVPINTDTTLKPSPLKAVWPIAR